MPLFFFADHYAHDHTHDPGVSSVSIVYEGEMDLEKASLEAIPHLLLYFSIDRMNIETSKCHNPFVVLDVELLISMAI